MIAITIKSSINVKRFILCGAPFDQFWFYGHLDGAGGIIDFIEQVADREAAELLKRLADGGQGGFQIFGVFIVVEADDREFSGIRSFCARAAFSSPVAMSSLPQTMQRGNSLLSRR